jgi:hypothetical protein
MFCWKHGQNIAPTEELPVLENHNYNWSENLSKGGHIVILLLHISN